MDEAEKFLNEIRLTVEQNNELVYLKSLRRVLASTLERKTRNGITVAIFSEQMRFNLLAGFPLLTTKAMPWQLIAAEILWFIDGGRDTNGRMSTLKLNQIQGKNLDAKTIWDKDQKNFKNAQFDGDCGLIYGSKWRNWRGLDQLQNTISNLKSDPFSRYHIISAWDPADIPHMCLPPCPMEFQFFVMDNGKKRYLSLHVKQRSGDMFLGIPFDIAGYALLLSMVAQIVEMEPYELVFTVVDCHLYLASITNGKTRYTDGHKEAAETQLDRQILSPPDLTLNPHIKNIDDFNLLDITLENYKSHPKIKGKLLTEIS